MSSLRRLLPFVATVTMGVAFSGCSSGASDQTAQSGTAGGSTVTTTTGSNAPAASASASTPASATTPAADPATSKAAAESASDAPPKNGEEVAVITTNHGKIVFQFLGSKAPMTVENFKKLANKKFYDGTKFHRVIPGFMIQGGDPNSKGKDRSKYGQGGPGYSVNAEFNDTHHARGIVSMARSSDPNSAGSQFFICVADAGFLDNQYTAFGKVISGMDVADKIVNLKRDAMDDPVPGSEAIIKSIRINKWPVK